MKRELLVLRTNGREPNRGERDIAATVDAEAGAAKITFGDGKVYTSQRLADGEYRIAEGERSWRATCASDGQQQWVFSDGEVYVIEVRTKGDERRHAAAGAQGLAAPMPATVSKILASAGQKVQRGETLLVLEAMKMELPVKAPADGVVKQVNCEAGELVQPGVALVEME